MKAIRALCAGLVIGLAAPTSVAAQDASLTPDQVRVLSRDLLRQGDIAEAVGLADALLARNPNDVTALAIRAEAALAARDYDAAIAFAARAYAATSDGPSKFVAARLAARGHAEQNQDTRAQFWLRRARQFAPTEETRENVADDFVFLRRRNPFNYQLSFGISPSSNINNGSESDTFLFLGRFASPLSRDARALAGLEYSGGVDLSYRLREDRLSRTTLLFGVSGKSYVIAPSAKDELEEERERNIALCESDNPPPSCINGVDRIAKGSDFSQVIANLGFVHRQILLPGWRPTEVRYSIGRIHYGGDPYSEFADASVSQSWDLNPSNRVALTVYGQNRRGLDGQEQVQTRGLSGSWLHAFGNGDQMRLTLSASESMSLDPDRDFDALRASFAYDFAEPFAGVTFGTQFDIEKRDHQFTKFQPGERNENTLSGRVSMQFDRIEYYGFQPVIELEAARTSSNIDLFDREYLRLGFDLRSSF